ncbi:TIM-barrel domain-containing protein [Actinacidiphila acididurans]|uniref:Carbohydrate-binding protein n=1 Tax=Actinacidiphila acididurans TaxID=2784346 RepID=A0ABS2TQK2_9ACTN|nr:TIM-barrel domain-containing protein [Actinacidiphila acididurans]MBM9504248.1 carbohydrate-binding protein [Actinacidiphila acididurans]
MSLGVNRSARRRRRRGVALVALTAALAGVTVAANSQSAAGADHSTRPAAVVSGDARFEVLSPTLIRTEYAGDARFLDAPTFNAIGRDAFAPATYTSSVSGGWLTVSTSALTLRYKVDSGPFDQQNLSVTLRAGQQDVTAAPWRRLTCAVGTLCEAEDLPYDGLAPATDHTGYTGTGFLAGYAATGATVSAQVDVPTAGTYAFDARYANALGGDGKNTTRTLTVTVDGGSPQQAQLPVTGSWDTWSTLSVPLQLAPGAHTIALTRAAADSGNVNVDSVALVPQGAGFPPVSTRAVPLCAFGTACEAEDTSFTGSAKQATNHAGYSGDGFLAELNQNAGVSTRVVNVPADGTYTLHLRYANSTGGDGQNRTRTATLTAAGTAQTISLPVTGSWDTWGTLSVPVALKAGTDDLSLACPDPASCHVNLDTLAVTAAQASAPPPHIALGGYRRGLDGVNGDNGAPQTAPGLLHQDGWYLLDDTPSAVYDPATRTATARPEHGGAPYQDGYVFGYGHDYKQALSDLATLTGPPELLPQWAYGVWYSEYFDRTAADYESTILPAFRSHGVPLDVLVTDTDFKSPNTWSGWEMDPAKYPDPKGFFDWSAAQGLHNTLNIHPSILDTDPQFAQAQATAKGKLQPGGCSAPSGSGTCYVFDFGDPDQLKAYMDLHSSMDQAGNDFWWLDWCCDDSRSSQAGVTPDAWINQQYAQDTQQASGGRGFVLSRAYGSLQSGGYANPSAVPTGPWADKRSTIHFTGDTASTWGTLRAEVGYTPGESAATGMSAISHDIGGHNDTTGLKGSETYTSGGQTRTTAKLPDDLYVRWVQFGAFQPIDRLHSNHSDRLPWQYGPAAEEAAAKFLNLRENLVPYTYSLAEQAAATGVPVVRPTYLEYPDEPAAYGAAGSEYFYGSDMLVAPVTTPGTTATTSVWFPPGQWTDYFTGKTYTGGTTQDVTTTWDTMPVFLRAGAIVPTRTGDVPADDTSPLTDVTLHIAQGAPGSTALYEDDGTTPDAKHHSATTQIRYTESGGRHTVRITPTGASFPGQVHARRWTLSFSGATAPTSLTFDGAPLGADAVHFDTATHVLTVTLPERNVHAPITFSYQ